MKRILTITLAAALLVCALSLPALAESADPAAATEMTDAVASATRNNRNNPGGSQQRPDRGQKPGRNGQQPQMPNQNGQQPQMPDQNSQQPQMPNQNGQQPQMPNQNGQQPQTPDQNSQQPQTPDQNSQQPQMPDQNSQQPQTPDQNTQEQTSGQKDGNRKHDNAKNGRTGKSGTKLDLDQLLKENVISQDVYDAIQSYLNSQAATQQNTENSSGSAGST